MLTRRVLLVVLSVPAFVGLTAIPAAATTFTVNSAADPGTGVCDVTECTLREAITAANVDSTQDEIQFNITPNTITLASQLPFVFQPLIIDGTTDPDSSRVRIDGSAVANDSHGLHFETSGTSAVRGLEIIGVPGSGGLGILGSISGGGTLTVGGTGANEGNVLSGNGGRGVFLQGNTGTYMVQGNIIGLQADGTTIQANGQGGALVQGNSSLIGGTTGVTPGGSCTGACNLISGNTGLGLNLSSGVTVQGNYIGTDVTGLMDKGNTQSGVFMSGTVGETETIGGLTPQARNVISGNGFAGIGFGDTNASEAIIQGNYIGVGADGSTPIPNSVFGISLGGDDVEVGGTDAGAGNVIAHNGAAGVSLTEFSATPIQDPIRGNRIFSNGGLGIDLGENGLTPNDADDPDAGANNRQNFPVLTSATAAVGVVIVEGTLNSTASTTFDIDIYASTTCDASGNGEGERFLGSTTAATDVGGDGSFEFTSSGSPAVVPGDEITATATDPNGNTSEFSQCIDVTGPATPPAISIGDVMVTEGDGGTTTASFTLTRSGDVSLPSTVQYATANGTATAPSDYQSASGTVTFAPTETTQMVSVTVNGDTAVEPNETFTVNLSNAIGATISDGQGLGTILNDDATPLPPAQKCPGFGSDPRPQLVGTEGSDTLIGTSAAEIVCGLGGNDILKGAGGKDLVLGGGGNDRMAGQGGKDVLKGQAGNDKMNGGPGVDRCQGGPGKDSAKACEKGRA